MTDKPARPNDVRYWNELEHAAFMLWFEHNHDAKKVEEILKTDPMWRELAMLEETDSVPQAQTIRRWARKGMWEARSHQMMAELNPLRVQAAALKLVYASEPAADSMARIARGENVTREDKIVADAAKFVLQTTISDSISQVLKPAITQTIDLGPLETMEQIAEAERKLSEGI